MSVEVVSGYVFEQRKAAIGYFQVRMCRKGQEAHVATFILLTRGCIRNCCLSWLGLLRITAMPLQLVSADYQPEREEYLEQMGLIELNIR